MRKGVFFTSAKKTAAIISVAAVLCLFSAARAQPSDSACVTFRWGSFGTLTAAVDGVPIASGDSVAVGKFVIFTAAPSNGYDKIRWWVNGAEIPSDTTLYTLPILIGRAVPHNVVVSFERVPSEYAVVTFRGGSFGTLTAAVDGVPIVSGDSVAAGKNKNVIFTAVPDKKNGKVRWTMNGEEIPDYINVYTLPVKISDDGAPIDVTASFEVYIEPPEDQIELLSGVLTFGPSPVRSGGEVAIFWDGDKEIGGDLLVLSALGDVVAKVSVSGVGKIGAWNTRGVASGAYLVRGMLKDKDGFKCRVLMLVGVVR